MTQKIETIVTLKDLFYALAQVPDKVLEEFIIAVNAEGSGEVEILVQNDDMPSWEAYGKKYPVLEEINQLFINVSKEARDDDTECLEITSERREDDG